MYRSMQGSEIKHRRRITSLTYYPRIIHFFIDYFVPERWPISSSAPGAPKSIDIEFRSEKRAGVASNSWEHSQPARSAVQFWLRASQFCGTLRCPVSFAVAPPGPGTIYRGPELNGPRTKRHYYISEKMPPFATAIAKGGPNDVVTHVPSHAANSPAISSNRRYPRIARYS